MKPTSQPASGPRIVPPLVLESLRLSGTVPRLPPDVKEETFAALGWRPGAVVTILAACLDVTGAVESAAVVKPSGAPLFNDFIAMHLMRWRYRPYAVNGKAVRVCGSKVFNVHLQ